MPESWYRAPLSKGLVFPAYIEVAELTPVVFAANMLMSIIKSFNKYNE